MELNIIYCVRAISLPGPIQILQFHRLAQHNKWGGNSSLKLSMAVQDGIYIYIDPINWSCKISHLLLPSNCPLFLFYNLDVLQLGKVNHGKDVLEVKVLGGKVYLLHPDALPLGLLDHYLLLQQDSLLDTLRRRRGEDLAHAEEVEGHRERVLKHLEPGSRPLPLVDDPPSSDDNFGIDCASALVTGEFCYLCYVFPIVVFLFRFLICFAQYVEGKTQRGSVV